MKNSWLVWIFVVGVVITVLVAFNYQGTNDAISLSEIFPEEETYPIDVEYEFVDSNQQNELKETTTVKAPEKKVVKTAPITLTAVKTQPTVQTQPAIVETQPTPRAIQTTQLSEVNTGSIPFTIQVASFRDQIKAEKALEELRMKNFAAYIVPRNLGAKGTWYRVYVGKYQSKEEANDTLDLIKKDYKDSFVISPQKS